MIYIIYRIFYKDQVNYVGSTRNYEQRKIKHKSNCFNEKRNEYNKKLYKFIRNNKIPWDSLEFEVIQEDMFDSKEDILKQETFWICFFNSIELGQNERSAWISEEEKIEYQQQYKINNRNKIQEKNKQYRINNRNKILEKAKEKVQCSICLKEFSKSNLNTHIQRIHSNRMKSN